MRIIKTSIFEQGQLFDPEQFPAATRKPLFDPNSIPDHDSRFSGDVFDDLDECGTPALQNLTVQNILDHYQMNYEEVTLGEGQREQQWIVLNAKNGQFVVDPQSGSYKEAHEWLYDLSESEIYTYITLRDFNKDFWESPPDVLYHGTQKKFVKNIRQRGLQARCDTRGMGNRSTGCAVFTSSNPDATNSYGDVIVEIYLQLMKADGFMPMVTMEEGFDDKEALGAIAHKLGIEDFEYEMSDNSLAEDTIVIHDNIPPQYIRISQ